MKNKYIYAVEIKISGTETLFQLRIATEKLALLYEA
jgi:hypothetical protein